MAKKSTAEALNTLIEIARSGSVPTLEQVADALPRTGSLGEAAVARRKLRIQLGNIADAVQDGQHSLADDIEDSVRFDLDPDAQKAVRDEMTEKIGRPSEYLIEQRRGALDGRRSGIGQQAEAQAQLDDLMARAMEGKKLRERALDRLAVAEHVTDEQLEAFKNRLREAWNDVSERRGDLSKRDGRDQRAADAEYAAANHVEKLMAEGVVDAPDHNADLPDDPRALAALIPRLADGARR